MRDVEIIGIGMVDFGELWTSSLRSIWSGAALAALDDAGVSEVDLITVGCMSPGLFVGQEHLASLLADEIGNLVDVVVHDAELGFRRVVLGQVRNGVEQLRTALVVEVLRRDHLPRPFEPFEDLGQLRYLFTHAATSFASRKPRNCQRASG